MLTAVGVPITFGLVTQRRAESQAENPSADGPVYEVASIKPAKSGGDDQMVTTMYTADGLIFTNIPLRKLIQMAYGVQSFQIAGGPKWLTSERYDIDAKMEESVAYAMRKLSPQENQRQSQTMLQALLADRFKLKLHHETKEGPVYALVIAKNGPKLKEAKPGNNDAN